jgi:hypothetical protein
LKKHGRIVALFKDVIREQETNTTTFRQRHTAINHLSVRFSMKGLYPTVLTQPSPLNNRFYPIPDHNAQAMIESLLYSLLAKEVALQVLLAYAVTAIFPAARPTMLTMSGNISYPN